MGSDSRGMQLSQRRAVLLVFVKRFHCTVSSLFFDLLIHLVSLFSN